MDMEQKVRESFARQGLMDTLGIRMTGFEPGKVTLECDYRSGLSQQHGFFHAGVLAGMADSACGYAALSVMPADADVLSVEFKINMLKPANTERLIAVATVIQAGRTLVVCEADVYNAEGQKRLARMTATMIVR